MRSLLGLVIGLYLTAALVVGGCGVFAFINHQTPKLEACTTKIGAGGWMTYVAMRAVIWPKYYMDESARSGSIPNWLFLKYEPDACR